MFGIKCHSHINIEERMLVSDEPSLKSYCFIFGYLCACLSVNAGLEYMRSVV